MINTRKLKKFFKDCERLEREFANDRLGYPAHHILAGLINETFYKETEKINKIINSENKVLIYGGNYFAESLCDIIDELKFYLNKYVSNKNMKHSLKIDFEKIKQIPRRDFESLLIMYFFHKDRDVFENAKKFTDATA